MQIKIRYHFYKRETISHPIHWKNVKCENNTLYFSPSHRTTNEVVRIVYNDVIESTDFEGLRNALSLFDDSMDIKYID